MKIQKINSNGSISSKGNVPKLSKLTKFAYSALFSAALIPAVDTFVPSTQKEQASDMKTEIKAQSFMDDEELERITQLIRKSEEQAKIDAYMEYRREKREEELRDDIGTGLHGWDFLKIIGGGLIIGGIAGSAVNEVRKNN